MHADIVRIHREPGETGLVFATSPDIRELVLWRRTSGELDAALPQAIADIYAARGMDVIVARVAGPGVAADAWVAFPADAARDRLEFGQCFESG